MANELKYRPKTVTTDLFKDCIIRLANGETKTLTQVDAENIIFELRANGYVADGKFTDKYQTDLANNDLKLPSGYDQADVMRILESVYKPLEIANANKTKFNIKVNKANLEKKEFQELWRRINRKSAYKVDFDTEELVKNSINAIDHKLHVTKLMAVITKGTMDKIDSVAQLSDGKVFDAKQTTHEAIQTVETHVKYDLIGKIVEGTQLTRACVAKILTGISADKFAQFKQNPEDFIARVTKLINEQKATAIIEHVSYNLLDEEFDTNIFTAPDLKGTADNTVETPNRHVYNYVVTDSDIEKNMAKSLEINDDVVVYAKLPKGFHISTPVGNYNPDWAIAFRRGSVKHVYFVAETKGSMRSLDLRPIEKAKIECARKHFALIGNNEVKYDVVKDYQELLNMIM